MKTTIAIALSTLMSIGSGFLALPDTASAEGFGPMNMMNPGKWFGGRNRRDYDDDYYGDPGYGPPPPGYGAPPPIVAPGYGYAPPPAGGYGYSAPAAAAPVTSPDTSSSGIDAQTRIRELEDRIRQLESAQPTAASPTTPSYGSGGYQPSSAGAGAGFQPGSSDSNYQSSSTGDYPTIPISGTYEPSSPVFRPAN